MKFLLIPLTGQGNTFFNRGMSGGRTGLFGPGDLPMPIEDDGDYYHVVPGSNVHMFEHGVPPIPYGMDDRPDPPYQIGGGGYY
mmetsp:Transcript_37968/g.59231  ORF Transcript_37968/g.59231 Transcript_37968/m.59231 type:complete len:83 (-) Transcript_37968:69-317(-)